MSVFVIDASERERERERERKRERECVKGYLSVLVCLSACDCLRLAPPACHLSLVAIYVQYVM